MFDVIFQMQDDGMIYTNKFVGVHEQG